jgi:hypothetical protein
MAHMAACSATLSSHQRHVLRTLLNQESQIVDQCNAHVSQFSHMMNELQCIHHDAASDPDARALKSDEFIRSCARLECNMNMVNYEIVPGAVQIAMTCDCLCLQAACFRVLYKWTPQLDNLRMKLLKIKTMCARPGARTGVETCARIEKTVQKILKLKAASHHYNWV